MSTKVGYRFSLFNPERQQTYFAVSALDEGGFGQVWQGWYASGVPIAIKLIKPTSDFQRDFSSWHADQSVHLMCLNHKNIVFTYDQFVTGDGKLVIIMEKGEGSLSNSVGQIWTTKSICYLATQILSALDYIHRLGVVHRDVTLKNIIWFKNGIFKLCDFGISKQDVRIGELARTFIGHKSYIPPELLYASCSNHQSDIYQLGLVLLTLMVGYHPIPENLSNEQIRQLILDGAPRQIAESLIRTHGRTAEIISIMLRRRYAYRYVTAAHALNDFQTELENLQRSERLVDSLMHTKPFRLPAWLSEFSPRTI